MTASRPWRSRAAEGLTIVLSILLALAADAAWDYRSDRAEETRLLEALELEFNAAVEEMDFDLVARREMVDRVRLIHAARAGADVPADSAAVMVRALLDWRFYTPGHAVLEDAVSSGRLDVIRSSRVRQSLMGYEQQRGRLEVIDERERDFAAEQLEPYLAERLSLDRFFNEETTPRTDAEAFFVLIRTDDTFASLVTLKEHRTVEAMIFSRQVEREIDAVLSALHDPDGG